MAAVNYPGTAKELTVILGQLADQGYEIVRAKRKSHWKVLDGDRLAAVCASTPHNAHRAAQNLTHDIGRYEKQKEAGLTALSGQGNIGPVR